MDSRPNPRKKWPDPQMCSTCKRKMAVVEIRSPRVEVKHLTSPRAPKKYIKKLARGAKKK